MIREIAPGTRDSLLRYIEHRIEPGGFLLAVLENNLKEACARADDFNQRALIDIVSWLYNEAPSTCWGSPEKVRVWLYSAEMNIEQGERPFEGA